ncbi:MAG: hypothetical protein JW942_03880 [Opitutales bacterium]|nr:hypothetical protein [Opitutales bacterium]
MISYHISKVFSIAPYQGEMPQELKQSLAEGLARGALRRFSDSGLHAHAALRELKTQESELLVSASSFAESRSLEEYIDSFPSASPARFQRSVHPSAVQQARVPNSAPLRRYIPLAGQEGLAITAVRTALASNEDNVILIGGEECGTWSVGIQAGSETGYAFGLRLMKEPGKDQPPSLGTISWSMDYDDKADKDASLQHFHSQLHTRSSYKASHPDMGSITLSWNNRP